MALHAEHELHRRRRSRNVGLALVLAAFVVLVLALTVAKVTSGQGNMLKGYDHRARDNSYLPQGPDGPLPDTSARTNAVPGGAASATTEEDSE